MRRHKIVAALVLLIAAAAVWWLWPKDYTLDVSYETTRLTEPLNPDGTVNYVAWLNDKHGEGVTAENNAAMLLIHALGPGCFEEEDQPLLDRLGITWPEGAKSYITFEDYEKDHGTAANTSPLASRPPDYVNDFHLAIERPWKAGEYPLVAEWLKANAESLALAVAASKRPRLYRPLIPRSDPGALSDCRIPAILLGVREISNALLVRAMWQAANGDPTAASDDLLAAHRLGRLVAQGPTLVEYLTGVSMDSMAAWAVIGPDWSSRFQVGDLRAHLAGLKTLPPLPRIVDATKTAWRYEALGALSDLSRAGSVRAGMQRYGYPDSDKAPDRPADWNAVARRINECFDTVVEAAELTDADERREAWRRTEDRLNDERRKVAGSGRRSFMKDLLQLDEPTAWQRDVEASLVLHLIGSLPHCLSLVHKGQMSCDLAKTALALEIRRAEKGEYPAKLDELVGDTLESVPQDRFRSAPLVYRRQGVGYVLYSVGPNGTDDGGATREQAGQTQDEDAYDIVVRTPPTSGPSSP